MTTAAHLANADKTHGTKSFCNPCRAVAITSFVLAILSLSVAAGIYIWMKGTFYALIPATFGAGAFVAFVISLAKSCSKPEENSDASRKNQQPEDDTKKQLNFQLEEEKQKDTRFAKIHSCVADAAALPKTNHFNDLFKPNESLLVVEPTYDADNCLKVLYPYPSTIKISLAKAENFNYFANKDQGYLETENVLGEHNLMRLINDGLNKRLSLPAPVVIFPHGYREEENGHRFYIQNNENFTQFDEKIRYKGSPVLTHYFKCLYLAFSTIKQLNPENSIIHIPVPFGTQQSTRAVLTLCIAAAECTKVNLIFHRRNKNENPLPSQDWEEVSDSLLKELQAEFSEMMPIETLKRIESKTDPLWLPRGGPKE